ncbi:hypothetical protein OM076_31490 [Solirubrobacter ginsenosidimutans]|uniref:Carboxypeptidase regulatory-like domain-containing protein n=1 Tax=Solirubrobacter ginsenosidimutans TaxID=490573 RepID=A0A9X3S2P9_9ACTN|nr:hypothetical protein [Solirubrobacter ginsenosidimutans]MDA0164835.1 hypothetical protein [Solirubrobacter ginsenosidimutans]
MRRTLTFIFVVMALFALAPARAEAGTYDVVACNAPGANGVNHSWTPNLDFAANLGPQPGLVAFDTDCADGLVAVTATGRQRANYLSGGSFNFVAPSGTTIVALQASRFLHGEAMADDPATPEPDGGRWDLYLQDATGSLVGGVFGKEQCKPSPGFPCTIGVPSGAETGVIQVATSSLKWGVLCGGDTLQFCYTSNGSSPQAQFVLYGATVKLQDDSAPVASLGGDLVTSDGWRRPTDSLVWSASDNAGIRSGQLLVDGAPASRADSACDATRPVPCPNVATTPIGLGPVGDGRHELKLVVDDSAGNATTVTKSIQLDGTAPTVTLTRASGKTITLAVSDAASGVASGTVSVRNSVGEPFRALPTTLANGRLTAKLDRGSAARVGIRVSVSDNAGNVTDGELSEMSLRVGGQALRGGAASIAYGRTATFRGQITTRDGQPLGGQAIAVNQTLRTSGAVPTVAGTVATDAKGRFSYRAPAGPSRQLQFAFAGSPGLAPLARTAQLRVRASSTIHASRRTLDGGGRVRFSGRLGLRGATVPRSGKLVDLQAFDGGRWRTFATARARGSKGAWASTYRFAGRTGRYPIRLRIRREDVFPYDLGYSRSVVVRVR